MHAPHTRTLTDEIIDLTSQNPMTCYQCGKCSAGCPIRTFAQDAPNKVVRFVQLGLYDKAFRSETIWLCAGCMTCSSRCPKNFNLPKFMDALRELAIRNGIAPSDKDVFAFHKSFLQQIENHGRLYELGLIRDYKLRSLHFMQDVDLAPKMLTMGKMGLLPHNIKNKKAVATIFKKTSKG